MSWIVILLIVGVLVVIAMFVVRAKQYVQTKSLRENTLNQCSQISPSETIFVSIPSYRDSECAKTVYDLFTKAYCPYRVYIGVYEQILVGQEPDCRTRVKHIIDNEQVQSGLDLSCIDHNLRVLVVPAHEAKGPMVARSIIETNLYRGEMFFMCIDSHMVMAKHWDRKAIAQLRRCQTDSTIKPILTMHPDDWSTRPNAQSQMVWSPQDANADADDIGSMYAEKPGRYLCAGRIQQDSGLVELASRPLTKIPVRPLRQMFWSPCFSFTYASAHRDTMADPECHYLFSGEEISMSVRFWTRGWDFFVPFTCLCLHKYDRSYRPTYWELKKSSVKAEKRIQAMLGVRNPDTVKSQRLVENIGVGEIYGPGTVRSIREYERFANIDFANCRAEKQAVLGLVDINDSVEVLCKYGSNENYVWNERNVRPLKFRR